MARQEGSGDVAAGRKPTISFESRWESGADRMSLFNENGKRTRGDEQGKARKSLVLAYLLWLLLGVYGAHRFYLRRPGTAIVFIALFIIYRYFQEGIIATSALTLLAVLWFVDAFRMPRMVRHLPLPVPKPERRVGTRGVAEESSAPAEAVGRKELGVSRDSGSRVPAGMTGKRLDAGTELSDEKSVTEPRHGRSEQSHPPRQPSKEKPAPQDILAAIEKLHGLYQAGALSKEEFEREKKDLLRKL